MNIRGKQITIRQLSCLLFYYCVCRYLPVSYNFLLGGVAKKLRYFCCKNIFKKCGRNVNVERMACFGSGLEIEIGDNSGLGINCNVPSNTVIGSNVMMGPNCYILSRNHRFDRVDIPIGEQGFFPNQQTIIGNDVWIGRDVLMTPGRTIKSGSIIAGGCVLCKDFPEYSIIGGNPSRLIRTRI